MIFRALVSLSLVIFATPVGADSSLSNSFSTPAQQAACDLNAPAECGRRTGLHQMAQSIKQVCELERKQNGCVEAEQKIRKAARSAAKPGTSADYSATDKFFHCDEEHLCKGAVKATWQGTKGCAIGGVEFGVDLVLGIPKLVLMGMQNAAECASNMKAKRAKIDLFNASVINDGTRTFPGATRPVDWRVHLDDEQIEDMTCGELDDMLNRRALADEDEERNRHINLVNRFGFDPEREIGAKTKNNQYLDLPKPENAPKSSVSELANKIIKNMGIAWNCYNVETQMEITCYAGLTAASILVPAIGAVKTIGTGAKLASAAGVSEGAVETAVANAVGKAAPKSGAIVEGGQAATSTSTTTGAAVVEGGSSGSSSTPRPVGKWGSSKARTWGEKYASEDSIVQYSRVVANSRIATNEERVAKATAGLANDLGRTKPWTPKMEQGLLEAHEIGAARGGTVYTYTLKERELKLAKLREAGFSNDEAKYLMMEGYAGNPPKVDVMAAATGGKQIDKATPDELITRYDEEARSINSEIGSLKEDIDVAKRNMRALRDQSMRSGSASSQKQFQDSVIQVNRLQNQYNRLKSAESNNYRLLADQKIQKKNLIQAKQDYLSAATSRLSMSNNDPADLLEVARLYIQAGDSNMASQVIGAAAAQSSRTAGEVSASAKALLQWQMENAARQGLTYQQQAIQETLKKFPGEIDKAVEAARTRRVVPED